MTDKRTLEYYNKNSIYLAEKYSKVIGGVELNFKDFFINCINILEIGFGSGRDLNFLFKMGFDVLGVDISENMLKESIKYYPILKDKVIVDSLPRLEKIKDKGFDGVLASAILMHLRKDILTESIQTIKRVLRENGKVLISIPTFRENINDNRDQFDRFFNGITSKEIINLFEKEDFELIFKKESLDAMRRGYGWCTLGFKKL